jgi:hypothetical protein
MSVDLSFLLLVRPDCLMLEQIEVSLNEMALVEKYELKISR